MLALGYYGADVYDISMPFTNVPFGHPPFAFPRRQKAGLSQHSLVELGHSVAFHALREKSAEEVHWIPAGPVLLTLCKSPGPLMRFGGDGHLAPGTGTFIERTRSRGRSPSDRVLSKGSGAFPGGL